MATQRVTGLASQYLKSEDTERTFKVKSKAVLDKLSAGANAEEAQESVRSSDQQDKIERTKLEFQGGTGSVAGITDEWVKGLSDKPAPIAAKLVRISALLTPAFFPEDRDIEFKQSMLDQAINNWIVDHGESALVEAPLEFGDQLLLIPTSAKTLWSPVVSPGVNSFSLIWLAKNGVPVTASPEPPTIVLESVDGRRGRRPILSGDELFIKHPASGAYFCNGAFKTNKNEATKCIILHAGDNIRTPTRIGEYFAESDAVSLVTAPLGRGSQGLAPHTSGRALSVMPTDPAPFRLVRWDPAAADEDD